MARLLIVAMVLFVAAPVCAQTANPDSYTLRIYNVGALQPLQTFTFVAAQVSCGHTRYAGSIPVQNPTMVEWDDLVSIGAVCTWTDSGTGPLFAVPIPGNYEATLTATNTSGTSTESAPRAPFARSGAPNAPTNVKVHR